MNPSGVDLPAFEPREVTLHGERARLDPLEDAHARDLLAAGDESELWRYMPRSGLRDLGEARAWIAEARVEAEAGREIPFAVIDVQHQRAVGSTRYIDIRRAHRGLEIGWTWLGKAARRTGINTECKLLLLEHAFEVLRAHRVTFKTDLRNARAQRAIERIGAVREGVLRKHMATWSGHVRDTVYYGVTAEEWPDVEQLLRGMLAASS